MKKYHLFQALLTLVFLIRFADAQVEFAAATTITAANSWSIVLEGKNEQLEVWDVATRTLRSRIPHLFNQSSWGATLSHDGRYLVMTSAQVSPEHHIKRGEWMLWDVDHNRLIRHGVVAYGLVSSVAFSPDDSQFALSSQHENPNREYDGGKVFAVESATGKTLRAYRTGWSATYDIAFSPDGRILALCGQVRPGITLPFRRQPPLGIVQLWDAHSERLERTLVQVDCDLVGLTFSPQGDVLVCGRYLNTRAALDEQARFFTRDENPMERSKQPPKVAAPDDVSVAQNNGDLIAWNLHTGKDALWQGSTNAPQLNVLIYPRKMRFSSDGNTLSGLVDIQTPDPNYPAGSGYVESRLAIRSWKIGNEFGENTFQNSPVTTIPLEESRLSNNPVFSPDDSQVMASDIKGNIHFWDSSTGRLVGEWTSPEKVDS